MMDTPSPITIVFSTTVLVVSLVLKRLWVKSGGSWLAKREKERLRKKKQRRRKRLHDFLKDPLLSQDMQRQLERGFGSKQRALDRMEELRVHASEEVTAHDVEVSIADVLQSFTNDLLLLLIGLVLLSLLWTGTLSMALCCTLVFVIHLVDNILVFQRGRKGRGKNRNATRTSLGSVPCIGDGRADDVDNHSEIHGGVDDLLLAAETKKIDRAQFDEQNQKNIDSAGTGVAMTV